MSDDDIARAKTRRWFAGQPAVRASSVPFERSRPAKDRGLRVAVPRTNVVQELKGRCWETIHNGSEADCTSTLDLVKRHFADKTYRIVTRAEADADSRRKTWSVTDADHVPVGSRVMLVRDPKSIHPSIVDVAKVFGFPSAEQTLRIGVVKTRHRRFGTYMVELENTGFSIAVERGDIIWPIPENVLALSPHGARR